MNLNTLTPTLDYRTVIAFTVIYTGYFIYANVEAYGTVLIIAHTLANQPLDSAVSSINVSECNISHA